MITEHAQALFDPMLRIKSGSVHDARREAEKVPRYIYKVMRLSFTVYLT